jgi:hypothetical protein
VSALICCGCEQIDPINPVEDPMNGDIPLDRMKAEIVAYQCLEHNTLINPELALIKKRQNTIITCQGTFRVASNARERRIMHAEANAKADTVFLIVSMIRVY